jgi:hypothetical protein
MEVAAMYNSLVIMFCLLMCLPISAYAAIQLPQSGQTSNYAASDDGETKMGKSWPVPRFSINSDQTVTDNLTRLIWVGDGNLVMSRDPGFDNDGIAGDGAVTWQHALDYIKKLNRDKFQGHNDWRLPNINELSSLINQGEPNSSTWLNTQAFNNIQPHQYCSSTTYALYPGFAWSVFLDDGSIKYLGKTGEFHLLPVRGIISGKDKNSVGELPKTGQTVCYDSNGNVISCADTGQDGELQTGFSWPNPRFIDNGDSTVTDRLTGLSWAKDARLTQTQNPYSAVSGTNYEGAVTWFDAMDYVKELNNELYLGFSDWRLPNRNELVSLVNYMEMNTSAWLNSQGFHSVQSKYWSSGTVASLTDKAWNVSTTGVAPGDKKSSANGSFVWPVRGASADTLTTQAAAARTLSVTTTTLPAGTVGSTYSHALAATGGRTPYIWTIGAGSLPGGLTLSTAGVISGTPNTSVTSGFTVQVMDKANATATKALSITINASPLTISTISLADGYLSTAYSQTLAASGGKTPYTWSILSGVLPAGLSLSSNGTISGTPSALGSSSFTVQVKDANNTTAASTFTITINSSGTGLSITTAALQDGFAGIAYSQTLSATGGKTPYTWAVASGSLPAGLTLKATTGTISGVPTAAGTTTFVIQVKDSRKVTATKTLTLTVIPSISISTSTLGDGYVGSVYNQAISTIGGKTPFVWSVTSGSLPAGLALNTSNGSITGTPTTVGSSSFTLQVMDANNVTTTRSFQLTVFPALSISTAALTDNYVGLPYSQTLSATGGKTPYTWAVISGTLPTGLSIVPEDGRIAGTPSSVQSSSVSIQVRDTNGVAAVKSLDMAIRDFASISGMISDQETGELLSGATVTLSLNGITAKSEGDRAYACNTNPLSAAGYASVKTNDAVKFECLNTYPASDGGIMVFKVRNPYGSDPFTVHWNGIGALSPGSGLPPNIEYLAQSFKPSRSGQLTKTSFYFPINYIDYVRGPVYVLLKSKLGGDRGTFLAKSNSVALEQLNGKMPLWLEFTFPSPVTVAAGETYYLEINGTFFWWAGSSISLQNIEWSKAESYASGSAYERSGGIWKQSANSLAFRTFVDNLQDIVTTPSASVFTMYGGNNSKVGTTIYFPAQDTWDSYTFFNRTFPDSDGYDRYNGDDLTINGVVNTGADSYYDTNGWLTAKVWSAGTWLTNLVTDQFDITFNRTLTTVTDANGIYSFTALPDGKYSLTFETTGYNTGTASGHLGMGQALTLSNALHHALIIGANGLADGYAGSAYSQTLAVSGGSAPYSWSITGGSLPAGLVLDTSTGAISGTPNVVGNSNFTILVTDSNNVTASRAYTIVVNSSPAITTTGLPDGYLGNLYSQTIAASGGKAPYSWTITGGSLPAGLILDTSTGAISGTPTISGSSNFTILETDTNNVTASRSFTIDVNSPLAITTPALSDGYVGRPYSQIIAAIGGKAPYHWSITAGILPDGLVLDSASGMISGTPTVIGGSSFTIQIADTNSVTAATELSIQITPLFQVHSLGDSGNVTVMEVTGNYDAKKADGSINELPRKLIAMEYFKTHADVDFLVFLSTFDYSMPEAEVQGFYMGVRNDTQGIGQTIFDNSGLFGSAGNLQGTIDLGNMLTLATAPYGPKLDETITTLNHEVMHRFGSYVRFRNPDGTLNTALLGKDSSHWSYLLDTKGSVMYGNGWKDNGNETFTSTAARSGYSPLDLYLMGMIPKEKVPTMLLIDNPAIDKTQLPQLGATISGTAKTITIDDIIAAEGARTPDASTSQKKFNVGFVLLTRAGDSATAATAAIETLRTAWAGRFAEWTQGTGGINGVAPSLTVQIDSPTDGATITGPDATVTGTVINSTGAETGVTVNGIPAAISGSCFIVNHVPLQTGANTITISATDVNGLTASVTRSVTAQAGYYLRIVPNVESGIAPLDVSIRLEGSFSITNPQVSVNGRANANLQAGAQANEYLLNLTVEGTYTITASAAGPDSQTYIDTVTITVMSMSQLDTLLKAKWNSMRSALVAGNIIGALSHFSSDSTDKYQAAFTRLQAQIPSIAVNMRNIELIYVNDSIAKYRIKREQIINGQQMTISYYLYFGKGSDGIWRIEQF